ncbi:hypothetical protein E6H35_03365 [Candidatus Bathyarchaeota archaeon]|nr:MAG: hypothetical protein E6H35_03365 [Candidatus Bathyarchaeota archaeon]
MIDELEKAETNPDGARPARTPAIVKTLVITLFVSTVLFSSWTLLKYFHYASLQGYIQEGIELSLSNFQMEIALAGLTGLLTSLFLQGRRRSRKAKASPLKMTPMSFGTKKPVHPLMMTQRPARDTKFVIRKTRNPGRISRNRMGERLPPSYVGGPETESST